jgi:hypothetical protein
MISPSPRIDDIVRYLTSCCPESKQNQLAGVLRRFVAHEGKGSNLLNEGLQGLALDPNTCNRL